MTWYESSHKQDIRKVNKMKLLGLTIIAGMLLIAAPASATDTSCEVDGELGVTTLWGECMTPSLYDEIYSYENLDATQSMTDPTQSIAEEAGLEGPDVPSERILGVGVLETPQTFVEIVWWSMEGPPF